MRRRFRQVESYPEVSASRQASHDCGLREYVKEMELDEFIEMADPMWNGKYGAKTKENRGTEEITLVTKPDPVPHGIAVRRIRR